MKNTLLTTIGLTVMLSFGTMFPNETVALSNECENNICVQTGMWWWKGEKCDYNYNGSGLKCKIVPGGGCVTDPCSDTGLQNIRFYD